MGIHDRDYYKEWLRQKDGYVERAEFRISEGEFKRRKHARAWLAILFKVCALIAFAVAAIFAKKSGLF